MKHINKKLLLAIPLLLTAIVYFVVSDAPKSGISGTISSEATRPNRAEDGYHGYKVEGDDGRTYRINATGYMNTPAPPDDLAISCADDSDMHEGDRVSFNLPPQEGSPDLYTTCYDKKDSGKYFFNKI